MADQIDVEGLTCAELEALCEEKAGGFVIPSISQVIDDTGSKVIVEGAERKRRGHQMQLRKNRNKLHGIMGDRSQIFLSKTAVSQRAGSKGIKKIEKAKGTQSQAPNLGNYSRKVDLFGKKSDLETVKRRRLENQQANTKRTRSTQKPATRRAFGEITNQ